MVYAGRGRLLLATFSRIVCVRMYTYPFSYNQRTGCLDHPKAHLLLSFSAHSQDKLFLSSSSQIGIPDDGQGERERGMAFLGGRTDAAAMPYLGKSHRAASVVALIEELLNGPIGPISDEGIIRRYI